MRAGIAHGRRGSSNTIILLALPVLLGFVAMGVDWVAMSTYRNEVQTAADAAAVAAASSVDDVTRAEEIARAYVAATNINQVRVTVPDGAVSVGYWDGTTFTTPAESPNAARVRTQATVVMPFSHLFGLDELTVVAVAGAGAEVVPGRAPDVVIALDVSRSMDPAELANQRVAAHELVDCIRDNAADSSRIAIVSFTGVDRELAPLGSIRDQYLGLSSAISSLDGCDRGNSPVCSGTNHAAGLGSARYILTNTTRPEHVGQVVVLLSDGAATTTQTNICSSPYYTATDHFDLEQRCAALATTTCSSVDYSGECTQWSTTQSQPDAATYAAWADDEKALLESQGAEIYSVFYSRDEPEGAAQMLSLATEPDMVFETPNSDVLPMMFQEICYRIVQGQPGLVF